MEEGTGPLLHVKCHPYRCNDKGMGPPKLEFLLRFDQNVEGRRVCTPFQDALAVKTWLDLLERLWSYGDFKLRGPS